MRQSRTVALGAILAMMALVAMLGAAAADRDADSVVRYDRESQYYRIRVIDYLKTGRRCLEFSRSHGVQSSMLIDDPTRLDLRYSQTMTAALAAKPEAKDVLLIGLGGASIPKFIQTHYPDLRMDIVELDPDVVKVCQEHFAFQGTPHTRVVVMDGRMYLKRTEKKYDLILLDAYAADHVPFHLTTREFVALVKDHLKTGGLMASNLWERRLNRFYEAELRTYQEAFPQVYRMAAGTSGNVIVFGSTELRAVGRDEWVQRAKKATEGQEWGFDLAELVKREYQCYTDQIIHEAVLTDDMAPVDTLRREDPKHFEDDEGAATP